MARFTREADASVQVYWRDAEGRYQSFEVWGWWETEPNSFGPIPVSAVDLSSWRLDHPMRLLQVEQLEHEGVRWELGRG